MEKVGSPARTSTARKFGISEYLAGSPYHLIVTPYRKRSDPLDPVRYIVETASADGIIFSRTEPMDARVRYLSPRTVIAEMEALRRSIEEG